MLRSSQSASFRLELWLITTTARIIIRRSNNSIHSKCTSSISPPRKLLGALTLSQQLIFVTHVDFGLFHFFKGYNLLVCSCYYFFCSAPKLLLCPPRLDTWLGCYTFNTSNGRPCGFCWMERPGIKAEDGRPTTAQSASWHPTNTTDSTMSRILLVSCQLQTSSRINN